MARLQLFLLGAPRFARDGEPLQFDTQKIVALVAYLAVADQPPGSARVSRDSLLALLWPDLDTSRARGVLRRNLSLLRGALDGEWLVADRHTLATDPAADFWLDVHEFNSLVRAGDSHGHAADQVCAGCLASLARAVDLYRGDFLEGFGLRDSVVFDDWQFFQAEALRAALAAALERLARGHAALARPDLAVPYARRWLALDPLHEPAHRQLISLYAATGQRSAALRQYDECVRILDEELGLPPSPETTALHEQVRSAPPPATTVPAQIPTRAAGPQGIEASSGGTARPLRAAPVHHNLPAQTTPFVGRQDELVEIVNRLRDPECRLLTLLGPGGVGKTRLALSVAEELTGLAPPAFEHGVFFVSLAPLSGAEAVAPAVAEALCCSFHTDADGGQRSTPREQLLDFLRRKQLLLVMDNYEHLLANGASGDGQGEAVAFLVDLLAAAPQVKILVTSRAGLKVQGEHLYPLTGLRVPDLSPPSRAGAWSMAGDTTAVDLFVQAASRARPDLALSPADWSHVVDICRLVEGMPLGILLAAAWAEMLSPAEIAAEIGRSLDFLATDQRDLPARQRSLRAVFDHSWRLLGEREQEVFRGLAVFQGGFAREAAAEIVGASLRDLLSLVNKSLLFASSSGRYSLHELLRQYAAERIAAAEDGGWSVRDRHSAYYAAALEGWAADLKGPRQQQAMLAMDQEIANARAAWHWAATNLRIDHLARGAEGIRLYHAWRMRYQEGEAAFHMAAEALDPLDAPEAVRLRARLLVLCSFFQLEQVKREAFKTLEQAMTLIAGLERAGHDVRREMALALMQQARTKRYFDPDPRAAMVDYERCMALYEEIGDDWSLARVLDYLGWSAEVLGDYRRATALCQRSLSIRQALGDRRGMADTMLSLGVLSWVQGHLDEADRLLRDSLEIYRALDDWNRVAHALKDVGEALVRRGWFEDGLALMESSANVFEDMGNEWALDILRPFLAETLVHLGRYDEANENAHEGWDSAGRYKVHWAIGFSRFGAGMAALAAGADEVALDHFHQAVGEFEIVRHPENRAWVLGPLGLAALRSGDLDLARQCIVDALRVGVDLGAFLPVLYALPATALLLAHEGDAERARQVYACSARYGFVANSRWFQDVVAVPLAAAIGSLSPAPDERAQAELATWDEMAAALVREWAGEP
ncbi:MAG TPA: BTAD domain-containing putative transcriptional regulator [Anaerolineae bacterium]|nr:BTAD domain-containing putative transcriptional regulator [Anaerolineae bacterium]